ncbi:MULTISPECIES: hypothetical protein [unclassified Acinetobacter]|uniref:hypothetical protein n=1 Tax=unclassified Acinetobacter TaxID=196816 RepID=UPI0002CFCF21|nr:MULTISPECIES: hypothetical protein [unclassified Acinetobacter]ENW79987.1 hypothetical protein F908_02184 [Acinetobacter sp. NIPH 284]
MQKILSIKQQVVRTSLYALILALVLSSILGYLATKHEVNELFDATLIDNTRIIKGLIDSEQAHQNWIDLQKSLDETLLEHISVQVINASTVMPMKRRLQFRSGVKRAI